MKFCQNSQNENIAIAIGVAVENGHKIQVLTDKL